MITITLILQSLSNAVSLRRDKSILYSRTAINILLYSSYGCFLLKNIEKSVGLFGGSFYASYVTKIFHIFICLVCIIIIQLTAYYPRKSMAEPYKYFFIDKLLSKVKDMSSIAINKSLEQFKILEYSLIILFIITGAILLMSSSDLISMFLSIELQSFGLYILSTIYKNSELSTKAGLTYFLLGGLSSCFILLGTSLLYTNTGTTNLDGIYVITSLSGSSDQNKLTLYDNSYIDLALIVMSVGFLFKVSAAPFHFWSPDVYDGIPTVVTTFVAIIAKISLFIFFLELLHYTDRRLFVLDMSWINCLFVSSLLSLIIGSILGLSQPRIKRLFAYSTISHIGFVLLALSINSIESLQAFFFYLMQYSITNLNAFLLLIAIGYSYFLFTTENKEFENLKDKNNSPIQLTKQIRGYYNVNPLLALSLSITVFSFAGIPPLLGFFGKQMVLSASLDSGYYFITVVAVLTSVISAVYYLNIVKELYFFSKPEINNFNRELYNISTSKNNIVLSNYLSITISLLTLVLLSFIFVPKQWLNLVNILALSTNSL